MDLVRSWSLGFLASLVTFFIVVGPPPLRQFVLLQLLVPFAGGLVGSLVHPAPHRERLGRHALAAIPPGMALASLGTVLAWGTVGVEQRGALVLSLVLALMVTVLAVGLMVWARRRLEPTRDGGAGGDSGAEDDGVGCR